MGSSYDYLSMINAFCLKIDFAFAKRAGFAAD